MSTVVSNFDKWLWTKKLIRKPHTTPQYGNCLFESVANLVPIWEGKPMELRITSIRWAKNQVLQGTIWGQTIWENFDLTTSNPDAYGKSNYLEYLNNMEDPTVFGTEYDIQMLCEFLKISIDVFSSSKITNNEGTLHCPPPVTYGDIGHIRVMLWHHNLHYEPIEKLKIVDL